jgi:hypothetical protein
MLRLPSCFGLAVSDICGDGCALQRDKALRFAAGFAQPGKIRLHLAVCFEGCERGVEEKPSILVQQDNT